MDPLSELVQTSAGPERQVYTVAVPVPKWKSQIYCRRVRVNMEILPCTWLPCGLPQCPVPEVLVPK